MSNNTNNGSNGTLTRTTSNTNFDHRNGAQTPTFRRPSAPPPPPKPQK